MLEVIKKQLRKRLKNGTVCVRSIDLLFILFAFICCIALAFPFSSVFITNANLTSMAKIIVEDVEFRGIVDAETNNMVRQQLADFNLNDKNPEYKFTGQIRPDGKIQLQDKFKLEIKVTERLQFANFTGNPITINIPITKKINGVSQNYYRNSE